jgi:hypothetical protein
MPLLDLRTDLKSLKYGSDRLGGGDSGLPYIKKDINTANTGEKFDDGLVRGGVVNAAIASAVDTARIAKFLYADQPRGVLFIAKQVGLQLSNPRLEVPKNPANIASGLPDNVLSVGTNGLLQPTRIYNLGVNTLAQIPFNFLGTHFNRHGLLPIQTNASKYEAVITANNDFTLNNSGVINSGYKNVGNRLLRLATKFDLGKQEGVSNINTTLNRVRGFLNRVATTVGINIRGLKPDDLVIDEYKGGPGSVYGIVGSTTINRTLQITNDQQKIDRSLSFSNQFAGKTKDDSGAPSSINYINDLSKSGNSGTRFRAISEYGPELAFNNDPIEVNRINDASSYIEEQGINVVNYKGAIGSFGTYGKLRAQIENQQKLLSTNSFNIYDTNNKAYSSTDIGKINYKNSYGDVVTIDKTRWSDAARETRVGSGRTDSINLTPLFNAPIGQDSLVVNIGGTNYTINDLCKFRIQAIDTDSPGQGTIMVFRAYITSFDDSVNAGWDPIKYVGRGEEFYVYNGYTRKINIGFKVAALSAKEMQPMYQKLNFLMSNLMPDYNGVFMRGPMMRMTVGNWIDSQAGVINSLTYTVSNDSPWEIALNEPTTGGTREMVLPHIVDVSLSFTPIGVQTQGTDQLAKKTNQQSNIAQNWNGANETSNYISPQPITTGSTYPAGNPSATPSKLY